MQAQRQHPSGEQITTATEQEERLSQAITALEEPGVVRAEAQWREQASSEVLRIDQNRRQHNAMQDPVLAGIWAGGESWDEDWLVRSLSSSPAGRSVDDGMQRGPVWEQNLDDGMGL